MRSSLRSYDPYSIITILGHNIYIAGINYRGSPEVPAKAYNLLSRECLEETVIAGVKGDYRSECTLAVAFLHTLERRFRGTRIRNLSLLFIMELYGYRQVRDVIENIKETDYLVVISLRPQCVEEALGKLRELGVVGELLDLKPCNGEELSRMVVASVRKGIRLE